MQKIPVIAIFDIGKTNKKLFLLAENYQIVWEKNTQLPETTDEDGDNCEDISLLTNWLSDTYAEACALKDFSIKALNFSCYGASLVNVSADNQPITPLYNYLKPYPSHLQNQFYEKYGGEENFALATASPVLGSLNSGMQLYRLKLEKPDKFAKIRYALHLPQYLCALFSGQFCSDMTSLGCHTNLWDFQKNNYHQWLENEGVIRKLAPISPSDSVFQINELSAKKNNFFITKGLQTLHYGKIGIGLHDSSAALIPYLTNFQEPFVLISTGTWCISLNPFNNNPLTYKELKQDCLCYISYQGKPVKASRLFAGYEHEQQNNRLSEYFHQAKDYHKSLIYNPLIIQQLEERSFEADFENQDLAQFANFEEAYHQLLLNIIHQQKISTELVLENSPVKRIFVDGGFSKNSIYMNLLSKNFPQMEVFAASVAQASALGAALAIHPTWNSKPLANDLIDLKYYANPLAKP
jgi:sugar (pentulose or hexulose) kinase